MEITLQSLLDEIARDGGDLAALLRGYTDSGALTATQIAALVTEARTSFTELQNAETLSEADLGTLQTIADGITALNAEDTHLADQATQTAARVAEIAAQAGINAETPGTDDDGDDAETVVEGEPAVDPDITSQVDDVVVPDSPAGLVEPIAASSTPARPSRRRVNLGEIARRTQRPAAITDGADTRPFGGALVASSEAQGVRGGHMFGSWTEAGQAFGSQMVPQSRTALLAAANEAKRSGREIYEKTGLMQLRREHDADLIIDDPGADSKAILDRAADASRIAGGAEALVAAAGWCAPSETLYELCELPCALEGILSTPEVSAPRGGVRWTSGIDFCDIYQAAGYFHYTEAELMADPAPVKPCMEIPCVDFNECRLEVDGMCITGDIPQARAYPEVVAQFLQGATCARAHRTNALKIGRIAAGSQNDGVVTFAPMGATASVLNAIDLKIMEYRYRGLRAQTGGAATLEMVVPFWLRGVIRGDLANRNGYANPFNVTDADIASWFASRGVVPRWVYDYQSLPAVCATPPAAPVNAWPTQVEVIIYEAGTWVWATQDVIELSNIYDSTLIRQNKYTALFIEDAFCLMNRCNTSIRFQIPICPSGNTGAQVEFVCGAPVPVPFAPELVAAELRNQKTGPALPSGTEVTTTKK